MLAIVHVATMWAFIGPLYRPLMEEGCIVFGVGGWRGHSSWFFWSQLSTKTSSFSLLGYSVVVASPPSQLNPGHFPNFTPIGRLTALWCHLCCRQVKVNGSWRLWDACFCGGMFAAGSTATIFNGFSPTRSEHICLVFLHLEKFTVTLNLKTKVKCVRYM